MGCILRTNYEQLPYFPRHGTSDVKDERDDIKIEPFFTYVDV